MATITQKNHNARNNVGATPWGNAHGLHYTLQTAANGSVVGGDSAAAVASGARTHWVPDIAQIHADDLPHGVETVESLLSISHWLEAHKA